MKCWGRGQGALDVGWKTSDGKWTAHAHNAKFFPTGSADAAGWHEITGLVEVPPGAEQIVFMAPPLLNSPPVTAANSPTPSLFKSTKLLPPRNLLAIRKIRIRRPRQPSTFTMNNHAVLVFPIVACCFGAAHASGQSFMSVEILVAVVAEAKNGTVIELAEVTYRLTQPLVLKGGITLKDAGIGRTVITHTATWNANPQRCRIRRR